MGNLEILTGDSFKILPTLASESVQCCVTSPPYWGLRDYEHPAQIGAEPSPEIYVENLVALFREVRRVLLRNLIVTAQSPLILLTAKNSPKS